jgi:membrane protease subunit HflK
LTEYAKAKDVTLKRIYLETMEEVLQGMNKIIVDDVGSSGVVPYLPLDQLQRRTPNSDTTTGDAQ